MALLLLDQGVSVRVKNGRPFGLQWIREPYTPRKQNNKDSILSTTKQGPMDLLTAESTSH